MAQDTKQCPFCGESININAKKCKNCGEWLDKKDSNFVMNIYSNKKYNMEKKIFAIIFNIIFTVLAIAFTIVFFVVNDIGPACWILLAILCLLCAMLNLYIIDRINSSEK